MIVNYINIKLLWNMEHKITMKLFSAVEKHLDSKMLSENSF